MSKYDLQNLFERLEANVVRSTMYSGDAEAVAFELNSLDSFLAGVASTLLSGGSLSPEVLLGLQRPLPLAGTKWASDSQVLVELQGYPALLDSARLLAEVREACLERTRS